MIEKDKLKTIITDLSFETLDETSSQKKTSIFEERGIVVVIVYLFLNRTELRKHDFSSYSAVKETKLVDIMAIDFMKRIKVKNITSEGR